MGEMLHLSLLGRVSLTDANGRSLDAVLHQTKRLALFAFLVLQGERVRRGTLLDLFWPDADDRHARRALSQALYYIAHTVGEKVVEGTRSEAIGVAAGSVECDVAAFQSALAAGDGATALELYRGELLPGFFVPGCPDWQDWVDRERTRLRAAASAAAAELSRREEVAGNWPAATRWARRALECAPLDEGLLRELMGLLVRAGDRAGALHEYERYAQWLDKALGDEPDMATTTLADEFRSAGPDPPGDPPDAAPVAAPAAPPEAVPPGHRDLVELTPAPDARGLGAPDPDRPPTTPVTTAHRRRHAVAGVLAGLLLLGGVALMRRGSADGSGDPGSIRIAVVPFRQLGTPPGTLARLAAALTAAVAEQLAEVATFDVVPVPDPRLPGPGAVEAGSSGHDAQLLLTGTVLGGGGRVHFRYTVVDARSGEIERTDTLEAPRGDSLAVVDGAARAIAAAVRVEIGRERRESRWARYQASHAAGRLVARSDWERQRAQALQRAGAIGAARGALEQGDSLLGAATEEAPGWAEPWIERARMAERLGWLEALTPVPNLARQETAWRRGVDFASMAIAIDPGPGLGDAGRVALLPVGHAGGGSASARRPARQRHRRPPACDLH